MAKNEIHYQAELPAHQAVIHLENLVESIKKGSVYLQVGGECVALTLDKASTLELSVGAAEKKGKYRLTWELAWKEVKPEAADLPDILISSRPPLEPSDPVPGDSSSENSEASPKAVTKTKPSAKTKADAKAPTAQTK